MFKRLFGKPEDELSGLNVNRIVDSDIQLPSKKPPPNVSDLVLPETLADEAKHPREVDLSFVVAPRKGETGAGAVPAAEITDAQIEMIAQRVVDKLAAGVIGERLRETVARIVSETSERLVREEIARIRSKAADE